MSANRPLDAAINYIELPAPDLAAAKAFYAATFGWSFIDYGPGYAAFHGAGLDGGLDASGVVPQRPAASNPQGPSGALAIFRTDDLTAAQAHVERAGGRVTTPAFDFPGGRRFHFTDPNGVELGVWQPAD